MPQQNSSAPSSASVSLDAAITFLRQRRWPEAERVLLQLAAQGNADACSHLGRLLAGTHRGQEAEQYFRQALHAGENAERLNDLAQVLTARRAYGEAKKLYVRALTLAPRSAPLHCNLAQLLSATGEPEKALAELKSAVACDAGFAPAQLLLGMALKNAGAQQAAVAPLQRAASMMPRDPAAQYHYGEICEIRGDIRAAIAAYKAALAIDVDFVAALNRLGTCYLMTRQPDKAVLCFHHYLTQAPGAPAAHYGHGAALAQLGEDEKAIAEFRTAGDFPGARLALAGTLQTAGHSEEACAAFEALCQAEPENTRAAIAYGDTLRALGRLAEARNAYVGAAKLDPDNPGSFRRLLSLGAEYPLPEEQEKALLSLAKRAKSLSRHDQGELGFALYRYYDLRKDYNAAGQALLSANAARRSVLRYDEGKELRTMEVIASVTPAPVMAQLKAVGDPSDLPVFVVGMPRSGTSLVEQILSSHPDVFGAGEIRDFRAVFADKGRTRLPALDRLSNVEAKRLAGQYLARLRMLAPGAKRVVDKLPWNFKLIGYIHALLPGAQILHIRRDPMDTCFSCFAQDFREAAPFCSDLSELGHYYRAYARLMAHWRAVLPEGAFLEVDYESLVGNFEAEARRMLAFCHLKWDPACLKFYQTARPVRTASAVQVRQPIYRRAVGRWKAYQAILEPLQKALER